MAKKSSTKKSMAKKAAAKKGSAKKTVAKKTGAKKTIAKKAAAKKTGAKKKAARKAGRRRVAPPPYRCVYTPVDGVCLKYMRNPVTGRYDLPSGGIRVPCDECEYF